MSERPFCIAFSVGEASGDEHGARLLRALKAQDSTIEYVGMGGQHLREEGLRTAVDFDRSKGGSLMGFGAVLKSLRAIKADLDTMRSLLLRRRPNLLIIIDYPDFNLRLAKTAYQLGIPVLAFIPPKVWAWRKGRIRFMKKYINHAALILPNEKAFYVKHGFVNATYVGHPFASILNKAVAAGMRQKLRAQLGLDEQTKLIALLPGSRRGELKRTLRPLLQGYRLLKRKYPSIKGVLPIATSLPFEEVAAKIRKSDEIVVLKGESLSALASADVGILKSGTSNLQAAFLGLPFVMFYRASKIAEWIVKAAVKVKEFSPVNIIRPGSILELLQKDASPSRIARELELLLFDEGARGPIKANLEEVVTLLSGFDSTELTNNAPNAYERVAKISVGLLKR